MSFDIPSPNTQRATGLFLKHQAPSLLLTEPSLPLTESAGGTRLLVGCTKH
jgi:hypothetical protein